MPYFFCSQCIACRKGKTNCCSSLMVFGVHMDGAMSEYVAVPSQYLVSAEGLDYEEMALIEPLAIGAHAVQRAQVKPGECVLIVGAGPIGLAAMTFARLAGARVLALDLQENRLAFCKQEAGAEFLIHPRAGNPLEQVLDITRGELPDIVMDATGNHRAIEEGFQYMASGGKYILIGLQKEAIQFSHPEFHRREGTLLSSRNATRGDFDRVIDCIRQKIIRPSAWITHRVHFSSVKVEFPRWLEPGSGLIKAMIMMDRAGEL
jgi:2-desacetyl-2-hydroxyethyl bacteriochlorophyllide A dehydrogenase